jgi:hypothetical protein
MMLIDGWKVPGYDIKVNAGVQLAGQDLSGSGSLDLSSDDGVKAGVLTVSTKVSFTQLAQLTTLIDMAKALDENGARLVRTVNSDLAKAYKIRKAKFDGEIKANEDEQLRLWSVSFKLLEVKSKSEREQQQIDGQTSENNNAQATDGHTNIQQQFDKAVGP